ARGMREGRLSLDQVG
ncbi:hypothetical protein LDE49_11020, partial [Mycobacterium tuberculosis]